MFVFQVRKCLHVAKKHDLAFGDMGIFCDSFRTFLGALVCGKYCALVGATVVENMEDGPCSVLEFASSGNASPRFAQRNNKV